MYIWGSGFDKFTAAIALAIAGDDIYQSILQKSTVSAYLSQKRHA
jgi:hypothetical protein